MSNSGPKSLSQIVTSLDSPLQRLASEARDRLALTEHLRSGLATDLGAHLTGCNLHDDGTLIILAEGPEWAARLRFESETLLSRCRERHPGATRVRIRVSHPET